MFENEQGAEITRRLKIGGRVGQGLEGSHVGTLLHIQMHFTAALAGENVSAMPSGAVLAGDKPAAPALGKWGGVIDHRRSGAEDGRTGGLREDRTREDAGDIAREIRGVTGETARVAPKA